MAKHHILVVDDNPDAQEILSVALGFLDYETTVASDGIEALEHMKKRVPDLVLLDLMMPRMNGFQVLNHMQSNPRTRQVPVIVVSAIENKMLFQLPGVSHVIQKARYSLDELETAIAKLLKNGTEEQKQPAANKPSGKSYLKTFTSSL
jgi:CheY-like chemotaxis protein